MRIRKLSERNRGFTGVITVCYDERKMWKSREEAKEFFLDCMRNSEGAERERYVNVYLDLVDGKEICTDSIEY